MAYVNLTPHDIRVYDSTGTTIMYTLPATNKIARVGETRTLNEEASARLGMPVHSIHYEPNELINLPPYNGRTVYVVSMLVGQQLHGMRPDVVCPDSSERGSVRDAKGNIIGTKGFVVYQ